MKMVKSLLLGTAAGLVAMSGAQAADLPVKAKPVQYVKICSLYGAGFYYVPGTDLCLKIGGYVRQQVGWGVNGNLTAGGNVGNVDTRATNNFAHRPRGYITADARSQTEYGTVRSYIAVGLSGGAGTNSGGAPVFNANRAFIQFAGFTFGVTQSFFDFYSGPATSFFGGNINPSSDPGDGGKIVTAYTAQFGGGLSASISAEGQRNAGVIGPTSAFTAATGAVTLPTTLQRGVQYPDIIGSVRIDQAWGGAQIMGAIHDATGQYNGATTSTGQPSTATGYAVGAGIKLLAPMIGPGDFFQAQFVYANGASFYVNNSSVMYSKFNGSTGYGFGITSDNVYTAAAGNNLTTAWGVNAAYDHYWNKAWKTSLYGAYQKFEYNATANAALCAQQTAAWGAATGAACNNNFSVWNIGSRTAWNVDSQTEIGVDIVYQRLQTASSGTTYAALGTGTQPATSRTLGDQGSWMGQFRIHRNFYP